MPLVHATLELAGSLTHLLLLCSEIGLQCRDLIIEVLFPAHMILDLQEHWPFSLPLQSPYAMLLNARCLGLHIFRKQAPIKVYWSFMHLQKVLFLLL